jgi:hypothetical protein
MIDYVFENYGCLQFDIDGTRIHFYGKDYKTNTEDYVIIKSIYYKDLLLNELFEFSSMTTDSDNKLYKKLENVNYISFNGTWKLTFTEDDIRKILKKKLT